MRRVFFILTTLLTGLQPYGQSKAGITGIRDSSYTISSEYNKHIKNYPRLRIAEEDSTLPAVRETDIVYATVQNRTLKLDVFLPKQHTTAKRTAVIFLHGGGWRSGNKEMHHPLLHALSARGYVCIAPEYRLSTEALYPAAIQDIKTVIRWVRKNATRYRIDVNRIVVAGHSAGGELAAFTGVTNGNKKFEAGSEYKKFTAAANAIIDLDGTLAFIHPESGEGDDSKKTSAATYWLGYSKTENPDRWKEASPLTYAGPSTPPTLFINSGVARMHAGRDDFAAILSKHTIYTEIKTFEGSPHTFIFFQPWFDSTVNYIDAFLRKVFWIPVSGKIKTITVAKDGSGDFITIQQALNTVPLNNQSPVVIRIREGVYKEKILLDSTKDHITLVGAGNDKTILTWDDHTGKISPSRDTINTRTSWSFKIKADDFKAFDITFRNDAGFAAGQAVAVESDGDRAAFFDCRFIGNQDVLFLNSDNSRQYFQYCTIEGTTDFIFGAATAWFDRCLIYSKKNSHVTAASTPAARGWGFIFNACRLTGDTTLHNVSLGRPWRPSAMVVYMNSYIGAHIKAEGWSNWNNTDNYKTARYSEYKNYGPSAGPSGRVSWSKQLNDTEALEFNLSNYLQSWYKKSK